MVNVGKYTIHGTMVGIFWIYPPHPGCNRGQMKVERLGFPILNMVHNPGGDWNPGWGVDLWYIYLHEWLIFMVFM